MPSPSCQTCNVPMHPGVLAEQGHGSAYQVRWCEGQPKSSWWGGEVKQAQWQGGLRVVAFRCPKCGLLQPYALPPS